MRYFGASKPYLLSQLMSDPAGYIATKHSPTAQLQEKYVPESNGLLGETGGSPLPE